MKTEPSLVEQAQRDILQYISNNTDSKELPKENDLAEILGVSRVVVREALSRLRVLGFIETRRKKGSTIVSPQLFGVMKTIVSSGLVDRETLRDLYQLRLMIEVGMAEFIFANKTEKQLAELEKIVEKEDYYKRKEAQAETDEELEQATKKLIEIDVRFHAKLYEMTGNKSLEDFQHILRHLFTIYSHRVEKDFHDRTFISHVDLYNVLRSGTPDTFRMAMHLPLRPQFVNMGAVLNNHTEE